jgi:pyridoxamine 5'-phosphate oxidase
MPDNGDYGNLSETGVEPDPLAQFGRWFDEAHAAGVYEPDAMVLATASAAGAPSARMVLLKGFDENGFRFFTNYESRKGAELDENPRAALLFHWKEIGRQVRIEGPIARVSPAESAEYFASRTADSRLSALASPQSRVIGSRAELEGRVEELRGAGKLELPAHWGGYRLDPQVYELWQRREHRLHDRLRYRRSDSGDWVLERLAP